MLIFIRLMELNANRSEGLTWILLIKSAYVTEAHKILRHCEADQKDLQGIPNLMAHIPTTALQVADVNQVLTCIPENIDSALEAKQCIMYKITGQ